MSGYQIEEFLLTFRRRYGYQQGTPHSEDLVSISEDALINARSRVPGNSNNNNGWITPQKILDLVEDRTPWDPTIEYEQQRRAGMFVYPYYQPPNPPAKINLVRDYVGEFRKSYESGGAPQEVDSFPEVASHKPQAAPAKPASLSSPLELEDEETPVQKTKATELPLIDEGDEFIEGIDAVESTDDADDDVVYGTGHITDEAMIRFVHEYPDSALKFLFRKQLDGCPLPNNFEDLYQTWQRRGLSRKKIRDYIMALAEWTTLPDISIYEIFEILRDAIYDMEH